jgi:sec-independent protein translocase protein TatA
VLGNLSGWHLVVILAIVLLLFGAPKLPALARSIAQSMRIFKTEIKSEDSEKLDTSAAAVEGDSSVSTPVAAKTAQASSANSSSGDTAAKS